MVSARYIQMVDVAMCENEQKYEQSKPANANTTPGRIGTMQPMMPTMIKSIASMASRISTLSYEFIGCRLREYYIRRKALCLLKIHLRIGDNDDYIAHRCFMSRRAI